MSEFQTREHIAPWLEMELASHLSPVAAPESLWDHIHQKTIPSRGAAVRWGWWPVAATLLLMVGAGMAWRIVRAPGPVSAMEKLAEQELRNGPAMLDFRSADPLEIRTWVKAEANIDIELSASGSGAVRLLGARLIHLDGAPVAAVAYRVGDGAATLLVARKPSLSEARQSGSGDRATTGDRQSTGDRPTTAKRVFSQVDSAGGARLFTWSRQEQVYTIASSGAKDPQAACLLCHADAAGGILKVRRL